MHVPRWLIRCRPWTPNIAHDEIRAYTLFGETGLASVPALETHLDADLTDFECELH